MKVPDQLKFVEQNHSVSYHKFMTMLATGIKKRFKERLPDLKLRVGGKTVNGSVITLQITGNIVAEDANDHQRIDDTVRQTIDALRNPSDLLSTLE